MDDYLTPGSAAAVPPRAEEEADQEREKGASVRTCPIALRPRNNRSSGPVSKAGPKKPAPKSKKSKADCRPVSSPPSRKKARQGRESAVSSQEQSSLVDPRPEQKKSAVNCDTSSSARAPPKELKNLFEASRARPAESMGDCEGGVLTRSRKRKLESHSSKALPSSHPPLRKSMRHRTSQGASNGTEALPLSADKRTAAKGIAAKDPSLKKTTSSSITAEMVSPFCCDLGTGRVTFQEWERQNNRCYCSSKPCEASVAAAAKVTGSEEPSPLTARSRCKSIQRWNYDTDWVEPEFVQYREISGWPHLNECVKTLEVLNIGGTNVLGEFLPFVLLTCPRLRSLGQWLNTTIYGLEILRKMPGRESTKFEKMEEFSYSTDRNYFCQPYIGFVPEASEFK